MVVRERNRERQRERKRERLREMKRGRERKREIDKFNSLADIPTCGVGQVCPVSCGNEGLRSA